MNDVPSETLPIITFGELLPGDVLLYRPLMPNEHEKQILQVTDSPYTHAAMYLGANEITDPIVLLRVLDGSGWVAGTVRTATDARGSLLAWR
ncbi:hypothetical protein ACP90_21780 [Labrenzia sp. CP4]|jgi:hypothetical protein|nr:hypothetical protein ACP90_21780 [Labrenzia sp. CP4]